MATFEEVNELVQRAYSDIWRDWYAECQDCLPATVTLDLNCTSAGYGHALNRIVISMGEGNLDDYDILHAEEWPIWKHELVHEMLHEYERKVLINPSEAGRALFASYPHPLWGTGHEELFCTSICEKAPYFGLTAMELIRRI